MKQYLGIPWRHGYKTKYVGKRDQDLPVGVCRKYLNNKFVGYIVCWSEEGKQYQIFFPKNAKEKAIKFRKSVERELKRMYGVYKG